MKKKKIDVKDFLPCLILHFGRDYNLISALFNFSYMGCNETQVMGINVNVYINKRCSSPYATFFYYLFTEPDKT